MAFHGASSSSSMAFHGASSSSSMAFHGASSSSSSSISSIHEWTYHVFLNFRGEDTRNTFVAHLHDALCRKGIITFMDDELRRGEEISPALFKAIQGSMISIVVFSQEYASSSWCLDELKKIVDCKEEGQVVLPVFYHVDPSDVRHHRSSFGKALVGHEHRLKDGSKVRDWKSALTAVANLSGWHLENGSEAKLINEIVEKVLGLSKCACLHVAKNPVGVESRVKYVLPHLNIEKKNDILVIGIYGIGGIGKTTIAKAIFNLIAHHFEDKCFLANVRETSKQENGFVQLQNTLLSEILGNIKSLNLVNVHQGVSEIKTRLVSKRVLLILDDVDQSDQLENLAGNHHWFGPGSRIIITTRDKRLLMNQKVNFVYEVESLGDNESIQLFSLNAFKDEKPNDDFKELTEEAIRYCRGLPLALTVLGTDLRGKDEHYWRSTLDKYKKLPDDKIQKTLQISYNGLEENEKNIFLDIACFFRGNDLKYVTNILDACGYFSNNGIEKLKDKLLLTIGESNTLEMHPLLQDMGREIVRQQSPDEQGERNRLWFFEDVRLVLEENLGTNKVLGIMVDAPEQEEIILDPEAFESMKMLKLFVNHNARFSNGPDYLSNELRLLDWPEYPSSSLPSNFRGENLAVFKIVESNLGNFNNFMSSKVCRNLTIMEFSNCKRLTKVPDVSKAPKLEKLYFDGCEDLVEVHCSVGSLENLIQLNLSGCSRLVNFPRSLNLKSLEYLSLYKCSGLKNFPEIECLMECLEYVQLGFTGIRELPSSFRNLIGLKKLSLSCCQDLKFPMKVEDDRQCRPSTESTKESEQIPSLPQPENSGVCNDRPESCFLSKLFCGVSSQDSFKLVELDLTGIEMVSLAACIENFQHLRRLTLSECGKLQEIPTLPSSIEELYAQGCKSLERFPFNADDTPKFRLIDLYDCRCLRQDIGKDVLDLLSSESHKQRNPKFDEFTITFPAEKIPDWFRPQKPASNGKSCEIVINEPADLDAVIEGIAFCVVSGIQNAEEHTATSCFVDLIRDGSDIYLFDNLLLNLRPNHMVLHYYVPKSYKLKGNNIQVHFRCESDAAFFVSCGVHLVRRQDDIEYATNKSGREYFSSHMDLLYEGESSRDLVDRIQLAKRQPDDEYLNLNWYPQQKRRSSISEVIISDAQDAS